MQITFLTAQYLPTVDEGLLITCITSPSYPPVISSSFCSSSETNHGNCVVEELASDLRHQNAFVLSISILVCLTKALRVIEFCALSPQPGRPWRKVCGSTLGRKIALPSVTTTTCLTIIVSTTKVNVAELYSSQISQQGDAAFVCMTLRTRIRHSQNLQHNP